MEIDRHQSQHSVSSIYIVCLENRYLGNRHHSVSGGKRQDWDLNRTHRGFIFSLTIISITEIPETNVARCYIIFVFFNF